MKTQTQGDLLRVMAKVELAIKKGESENSKLYILSQDIKDLTLYDQAKARVKFLEKETKVLENVIENDLRQVVRFYGIDIRDGSDSALDSAICELKGKGKTIDIQDKYYGINEKIVGESPNLMTVIEEDGILSAAIEVSIYG